MEDDLNFFLCKWKTTSSILLIEDNLNKKKVSTLQEAEAKKKESTRMEDEDQELIEGLQTLEKNARRMEIEKEWK